MEATEIPRATRRAWLLVGLAFWLEGCAPVRLIPLAPTSGNESIAVAPSLEVRANADASQRLWTVPHGVIPVRLSVRNAGDASVYIEFADIQLRAAHASSSAVPPASIEPRRRLASLGLDPGSPFVAPQIGGNSVFGRSESLVLGPPIASTLPVPQDVLDPARGEILASAFNGGEIESGQTLSGLVYFRGVPAGAEQLTLRVGVRPTRAKGSPSSVVEIAYAVRS